MGLTTPQVVAAWLIAGTLLFCASTMLLLVVAAMHFNSEHRGRRRPACQGWHDASTPAEGPAGATFNGHRIERRDV